MPFVIRSRHGDYLVDTAKPRGVLRTYTRIWSPHEADALRFPTHYDAEACLEGEFLPFEKVDVYIEGLHT